jgi:predicted nucleic acid-binding protein
MSNDAKLTFILDTSPLTSLCRFPLDGIPYLREIASPVRLFLPQAVLAEARQAGGVLNRVAYPLVKGDVITQVRAPLEPTILDVSYGHKLGKGEIEVIKIALNQKIVPVIDDRDAFIVASRFGLQPVGFQDFIIRIAQAKLMTSDRAIEIFQNTAAQYPAMFLLHTLDTLSKLGE